MPTRTVSIEQAVLAKNDRLADANRRFFDDAEVFALNLMSSPGSGKTTLLERTLRDLRGDPPICVIEGDQHTSRDAERIRAAGARAVQINTGALCHLEASMIDRGIRDLAPERGSIVVIENVGNLVCPALFDLGEGEKAVLVSVTEGEDKPLKYPYMFRSSRLMLLTKVDLLPHLAFDAELCAAHAREINPGIEVLHVSALNGEGMATWYRWLLERRRERMGRVST